MGTSSISDTVPKILVIKLGALGDFIYALGPMKAIREHHHNAHITLLTTKPYEDLGKECGYFDDVWIDEKPRWMDLAGWLRLRNLCNRGKYTRVYDLQNNDRTNFYLYLFNPRPEWVGAGHGASHRNTDPQRVKGHAFHGHQQTLALGDVENVALDQLDWMKSDLTRFNLKKPYVLILAGSAPKRPEKRWPPEHFGAICEKLLAQNIQPVLLGTHADAANTSFIAALSPQILNLTGKTSLRDIPALARDAVAAIGNDTGPMHMVAVTGCPSLVLFCTKSSTPEKHGPLGAKTETIAAPNLAQLSVDSVWEKFQALS